jgi:glycerol-3-phosphate dehydrogenase (NAD(P)+)
MNIGVLGAGAWGTALAQLVAHNGHAVRLWAREADVVYSINTTHTNTLYLPGIALSDRITATDDISSLRTAEIILAVTPAQFMRATLSNLAPHITSGTPVVLCSKGIEQSTLKLMTAVLAETIPQATIAALSGPSFAADVARGLPTAVTLACTDMGLAGTIAKAVSAPHFRPYLSADVTGAEVGGAIKNVLAVGCGITEGHGLGASARAALIARGFAEMTRIGVALGAETETIAGLSGLGDLVLTCTSVQSRNYSLGIALGRGQTMAEAMSGKASVAEGAATAPALVALCTTLGVDAPITRAVADIISGTISVDAAVAQLLARPITRES